MSYDPVTIGEAAQLEVLLFVALAFVGALAVVFWGFQTYQFGRIIRDTPPEPISGVAIGRTEIEGTVLPDRRVFDQPFAEGQCVYVEFEVEEYRNQDGDDDGKEWVTIQSGARSEPFYVDDGTGRMHVEPNEETLYELSETCSRTIETGRGDSPPPVVREFLGVGASPIDDDAGDDSGGWFGGLKRRVTGLFGGGEDDSQTGDSPTAGDASDTQLEERPPRNLPDGPADSDGPADGEVDDAEDTDTRYGESVEHVDRNRIGSVSTTNRKRRYSQTVLPVQGEAYVFGGATSRDLTETDAGSESIYISTDPGTEEFIISDRDEFALASTYRTRSAIYIVAGIVSAGAILALLAQILITGPLYGVEATLP
jgi:hypothetical protein